MLLRYSVYIYRMGSPLVPELTKPACFSLPRSQAADNLSQD